jgi:nicotinamide riboside kinase
MADTGWIVALLGAESTGKTTLAHQLAAALTQALQADAGALPCPPTLIPQAVCVEEYLREFCDRHQRTPGVDEQIVIAREQTRRILAAAQTHAVVVADTTALLTAVYSEQVFGDTSLYPVGLDGHRIAHLTLLTGLDLPWQADGLQRDGPHVREPVDHKLRTQLLAGGVGFSVITGQGPARLQAAAAACLPALQRRRHESPSARRPAWRHLCGRCGDPGCERHLFPATSTN